MSFTIYAFNDSYPLYLFLNGLGTFLGSPAWTSMVFLCVSLVTLAGVIVVQQRSLLGYGKAYAAPVLLYCLLFLPTAQLHIEDQWSHDAYSVDKMPVALAIPLAAVTTIEKNILDLVEQHITPPDAPSFADFDFFLEASALSQLLNGQTIHNYETLNSIARYYDDCVLKGIATGFVNESLYLRSGQLLIDSYMPWSIYFTEITNPDGSREVLTCKMAYNKLFASVAGEAVSAGPASIAAYLNSVFGGRHKTIADTMSAMDSLGNAMFPGHQSTGEALFRQAFMINGLQSSLTKANPQLLAAITQAEVAQSTGISSAASVYVKKLPKLRAMIKLIVIGLFPLVGAAFLAQAGRPFWHWSMALLAVSLWLPIMAIIKASYIASAIAELQGVVLATNGMTLPNKIRLMTWITDTSTVAGILAFAIPTITATVLQILAPRVALFAGSIAAMGRGAEGFSQRAGMQALPAAERSARELEQDKINAVFLEAGDSHLFRNQRMNDLVRAHDNVAFARNTGSSPLQYGGTNTSAIKGQGYTIQGGLDTRSSSMMQQAVARQEARVSSAQASAAYSLAMGHGVSKGRSDFDRWENSLSSDEQKQLSDVEQTIAGITERAAKAHGYSGEEAAQLSRQLSAAAYAGVDFSTDKQALGKIASFMTGVSGKAGGRLDARAGVTTGETEKATRTAQEIMEALASDSSISSYTANRAVAIAQAHRTGTGEEWSDRTSKNETYTQAMQRVNSESQSLTATRSAIAQQQSARSATAGRSINTGDLLAVTSRGDLEIMAMNQDMTRLRGALERGVNSIDDLRIAANADMSSLLRRADTGDTHALASAMAGLDVIGRSSQYNAHDARIGLQVLQDRAALNAIATGSQTGLPSVPSSETVSTLRPGTAVSPSAHSPEPVTPNAASVRPHPEGGKSNGGASKPVSIPVPPSARTHESPSLRIPDSAAPLKGRETAVPGTVPGMPTQPSLRTKESDSLPYPDLRSSLPEVEVKEIPSSVMQGEEAPKDASFGAASVPVPASLNVQAPDMSTVRENFEKLDFSNTIKPVTKNPGLEDVTAARGIGHDLGEKAATHQNLTRHSQDEARQNLYAEGQREADAVSSLDTDRGTFTNAGHVVEEEAKGVWETWSNLIIPEEGLVFPAPEDHLLPKKEK